MVLLVVFLSLLFFDGSIVSLFCFYLSFFYDFLLLFWSPLLIGEGKRTNQFAELHYYAEFNLV